MVRGNITLMVVGVQRVFHFGAGNTVLRDTMFVTRVFVSVTNMGGSRVKGVIDYLMVLGQDKNRRVSSLGRFFCSFYMTTSKGSLPTVVRVVIVVDMTGKGPFSGGNQRLNTTSTPLLFHMTLGRLFVGVLTSGQGHLLLGVFQLNSVVFHLLLFSCHLYLNKDFGTPRF